MIILDTNGISEAARIFPSDIVRRWFAHQSRTDLHTTAVTEAEILLGIALMPDGKHRFEAERANARIIERALLGRVLPFDRDAAHEYASIVLERQRIGQPIQEADAQIAAIARSRGAILATRNVRDFEHCGVEIVNPWTA
jgi:predicted nucleic acid-binding protein